MNDVLDRNINTQGTVNPNSNVTHQGTTNTLNPQQQYGDEEIVRAKDNVIGVGVSNKQDENLGKIEDLAIYKRSGKIAYAVLSFGGIMGLGDKLFALPWNAISYCPDREEFILNRSKEELKTAPGFDKDNWPNMADKKWESSIHSYYGTTPFGA